MTGSVHAKNIDHSSGPPHLVHHATIKQPPGDRRRAVTGHHRAAAADHRNICSIPDEFRPWGCSALDAHNGLRQIEARHPALRGAKSAMQTIRTRTPLRARHHRGAGAARPGPLGLNRPTASAAWPHPRTAAACRRPGNDQIPA
ncbi:hypothetical protein CP972_07705 [Streptomyces prasinus]|uniref:Uncharacterized protein n=1 Tax=Streptomyces prasinus TaxID=67345 RepID=A0ABX6AUC0_9ACTN|nr:hypothetical protein CP972_07705 [Streptomyces prasinus]